jgi:hypothetical protein
VLPTKANHVLALTVFCSLVLLVVVLVAVGPLAVAQAAPSPFFEVRPFQSAEYMWGQEWAPDSEVLIEIDDPDTAEAVDFSMTAGTDGVGFFELFDVAFDIKAGHVVTVSQGAAVKTHVVIDLTVTRMDAVSETVSGVGAPNAETFVAIDADDQEGSQRTVMSDDTGAWTADFSVPGADGKPAFDIGPGMRTYTNQHDGDWDMTGTNFRLSQGWQHNPATGHDYLYVADPLMPWAEAEENAVSLGGHLVTINDAAEGEWLVATFGTEYWIGLNDIAVEGEWVWVSGEPATFTNWQPGEPNDGQPGDPSVGEDAAAMRSIPQTVWNDRRADLSLPFVVEVGPPAPLATTPSTTPGFVPSVPLPTQISSDPEVIGTNLALALVFAAIFGFTSTLFNSTLEAKNAEIVRLFAPLGRVWSKAKTALSKPAVFRRLASGRAHGGRRWLESLAIVIIAGLIYALLDPGFGFSIYGLTIFVSLALSIALVTYGYEGVQALVSSRRYRAPAAVRLFPIAIGIAIVCVLLSRLTGFKPGYLYGFVGGMAFLGAQQPDDRRKGRLVLLATGCLFVVSLAAWLLAVPLTGAVEAGSSWLKVLQGICVGTFVVGLEGLFFGLIPLSITDGGTLFRWNKVVWAGAFGLAAFLFWHVLLNKNSKYGAAFAETSVRVVVALLVFWTLVTVGTYWYFRKPRGKPAANLPAGHDGSKPT